MKRIFKSTILVSTVFLIVGVGLVIKISGGSDKTNDLDCPNTLTFPIDVGVNLMVKISDRFSTVDDLACPKTLTFPIDNDKEALCFSVRQEFVYKTIQNKECRFFYWDPNIAKSVNNEGKKEYKVVIASSDIVKMICTILFLDSGELLSLPSCSWSK